jgi:hypothetical protein
METYPRPSPDRIVPQGLTIMSLLLGGARFVDGVYVPAQEASAA